MDTEKLANKLVAIVEGHTNANVDQDGEAVFNINYWQAIEDVKAELDTIKV